MFSSILKILFYTIIIRWLSCQISYTVHTLDFLEEKLNKKLDTNIFLFSETTRQEKYPNACFASDGPYCYHLQQNS